MKFKVNDDLGFKINILQKSLKPDKNTNSSFPTWD